MSLHTLELKSNLSDRVLHCPGFLRKCTYGHCCPGFALPSFLRKCTYGHCCPENFKIFNCQTDLYPSVNPHPPDWRTDGGLEVS
ncbi:hypothetical protein ACSBR2_038379 [Camellia fascicularis]